MLYAEVIGPMPPYYEVAEAIWGPKPSIDSDGDSEVPESTKWRELTLTLRPAYVERLDIDPLEHNNDELYIRATSKEILDRATSFLLNHRSIQLKGSLSP